MPITAKLSRGFYERFGDDIVNELVEWLNAVDTSYRQEFKDLFEANFARLEARLLALEGRMTDLEGRIEKNAVGMEARLEARMEARLEAMKSELLRWMFLFWVGTMGTVLAILKL